MVATNLPGATGRSAIERQCLRAAGHLRQAYERLAAEPSEVRSAELGAIVRESLLAVGAEDREAFLDGLREHFPTWDATASVAAAAPNMAAIEAQRKADEAKLNDAAFLVQRLLALAPSMNDSQKKQIAGQLVKAFPLPTPPAPPPVVVAAPTPPPAPVAKSAPPVPAPSAASSAVPLDDGDGATSLRKTLSIPGNQPIDSNRVALSLSLLFELVTSIDEVAWGVWDSTLAAAQEAQPRIRRRMWLKPTLTRLIVGGPPGALVELEPAVRDLRGLTAGLLNAVGDAPKQAQEQFGKMSPERIEETLKQQGGFSMKSLESRCWEQYRKRFSESSAQVPSVIARGALRSVDFFLSGATK